MWDKGELKFIIVVFGIFKIVMVIALGIMFGYALIPNTCAITYNEILCDARKDGNILNS